MVYLIYTILVILQQYKGISTVVPDPCPSSIQQSIAVVDMCRTNSVTEDKRSGSDILDSVLLRIMIQQDNCICRLTIDNQTETVFTVLRKYGGLTSSTPVDNVCGLAVDIHYIPDTSTGDILAPIECSNNVGHRIIPLNTTLQFKSRIINGTFTRGYCMQILRDINSDHSQVLRIDCDAPMTTEKTTEKTKPSHSLQSSPQATESVKSTTKGSSIDAKSTAPTTDNSANVKHQQMTTATDPTTGIEQTAYIAIGAGSGIALILLVVLVVICIRKSTQKAGTNGNVNKSYQQEESDDKLQDNVLYVPAEEFDIAGGKYSTTDVDTPRSSNKRLSVAGNYSTADVDATDSSNTRLSMEGNYSTVDEDIPNIANNRISMDGDYSTVKLDEHLDANCSYPANSELGQTKGKQKPTIKPKPKSPCINNDENRSSDQNIKHITPPNGSNNVYAVVDKSSKNLPTANVGKGEATCQPDQTYAVVDKARKRKSSPDETNKKKFEIDYDTYA